MQELSGRTAVITGAASGIGLELARRFGAEGMQLMLADVEADALRLAHAELEAAGVTVDSHVLDVRDRAQVRALEAASRERFGNVHLLCNNAGVGGGGPIAVDDDLALWEWTLDVNLWGVIYGCKAFLPDMIAHGEPCHVVNTASMAGLGPSPLMGAYTISKYGVVALSETLSLEMQMTGTSVGVSVLCPAFVRTGIAESKRNLPADLLERHGGEQRGEDIMRSLVAAGIEPTAVAAAVHQAVVDNRFWILTHDGELPRIIARAQSILDNEAPSFDAFR